MEGAPDDDAEGIRKRRGDGGFGFSPSRYSYFAQTRGSGF